LELDDRKTDWAEESGKAVAVGIRAAAGLPLGPAGVAGGAIGGSLPGPPTVWLFQRMRQPMERTSQKVLDVASETVGL
jgi:hypothetical protein